MEALIYCTNNAIIIISKNYVVQLSQTNYELVETQVVPRIC